MDEKYYTHKIDNDGNIVETEKKVDKKTLKFFKKMKSADNSASPKNPTDHPSLSDTLILVRFILDNKDHLMSTDFNCIGFLINRLMFSLYANEPLFKKYRYLFGNEIKIFERFGYFIYGYSGCKKEYTLQHPIFWALIDNIVSVDIQKIKNILEIIYDLEQFQKGGDFTSKSELYKVNAALFKRLSDVHKKVLHAKNAEREKDVLQDVEDFVKKNQIQTSFEYIQKFCEIVDPYIIITKHLYDLVNIIKKQKLVKNNQKYAFLYHLIEMGELISRLPRWIKEKVKGVPWADYILVRDMLCHLVDQNSNLGDEDKVLCNDSNYISFLKLFEEEISGVTLVELQKETIQILLRIIVQIRNQVYKNPKSALWLQFKHPEVVLPTPFINIQLKRSEEDVLKKVAQNCEYFANSAWKDVFYGRRLICYSDIFELEEAIIIAESMVHSSSKGSGAYSYEAEHKLTEAEYNLMVIIIDKFQEAALQRIQISASRWVQRFSVSKDDIAWFIDMLLKSRSWLLDVWLDYLEGKSEYPSPELISATQAIFEPTNLDRYLQVISSIKPLMINLVAKEFIARNKQFKQYCINAHRVVQIALDFLNSIDHDIHTLLHDDRFMTEVFQNLNDFQRFAFMQVLQKKPLLLQNFRCGLISKEKFIEEVNYTKIDMSAHAKDIENLYNDKYDSEMMTKMIEDNDFYDATLFKLQAALSNLRIIINFPQASVARNLSLNYESLMYFRNTVAHIDNYASLMSKNPRQFPAFYVCRTLHRVNDELNCITQQLKKDEQFALILQQNARGYFSRRQLDSEISHLTQRTEQLEKRYIQIISKFRPTRFFHFSNDFFQQHLVPLSLLIEVQGRINFVVYFANRYHTLMRRLISAFNLKQWSTILTLLTDEEKYLDDLLAGNYRNLKLLSSDSAEVVLPLEEQMNHAQVVDEDAEVPIHVVDNLQDKDKFSQGQNGGVSIQRRENNTQTLSMFDTFNRYIVNNQSSEPKKFQMKEESKDSSNQTNATPELARRELPEIRELLPSEELAIEKRYQTGEMIGMIALNTELYIGTICSFTDDELKHLSAFIVNYPLELSRIYQQILAELENNIDLLNNLKKLTPALKTKFDKQLMQSKLSELTLKDIINILKNVVFTATDAETVPDISSDDSTHTNAMRCA